VAPSTSDTEQEQQKIIRFIEADRPLPDKYRFLLFEDKREVELVWNGKTSEVCNIMLPLFVNHFLISHQTYSVRG
jgi:hypothetical protein